MKKNIDLERATGLVVRARRAAAFQKREAGEPRNPFQAKPGQEKSFEEAGKDVIAYDLLLNLVEKEAKAERARALFPYKQKARRFADRALDFIVGVGIVSIGALGVSAASLLLRAPDVVTRATAIVGVLFIIAREVINRWKQK